MRKKAGYLLLSHLLPAAEDLHGPSINACNVEAALVSAFVSTHQEAAVLSGQPLASREAGRWRHAEAHPAALWSPPAAAQLLKALEARMGHSCPKDLI